MDEPSTDGGPPPTAQTQTSVGTLETVEPSTPQQQAQPDTEKRRFGPEFPTEYERRSLRIQKGIWIVTAVYAFVAGLQWNEMQRSWNLAQRQGRPWVVLDRMAINEDMEHTFKAAIKNVGGGPAFDVGFALECTNAAIGVQGYDLYADAATALDRTKDRTLKWPSIGESAVRSGYVIQSNLKLAEPDGIVPCCFGRITYRDGAGSSYESGFAMLYDPIPGRVREQASKGGLGPEIGWLSNSFADASDFRTVGDERLNYAR